MGVVSNGIFIPQQSVVDFSCFFVPELDETPQATFANVNAIYTAFDSLVTSYPRYFRRGADLGVDASGSFTIARYTLMDTQSAVNTSRFGGTNRWNDTDFPKRRILLNMSIHGGEKGGVLAGYRAIKSILESNEAWANFIKANAIITIVPCSNPWGYNNNNGTNCNGININRDFKSTTKQAETNLLINLFNNLNSYPNFVGLIDSHTSGGNPESYSVCKTSYPNYKFYAYLTNALSVGLNGIGDTIFNTTNRNHFPLWNYESESSFSVGQFHEFCNENGKLGISLEIDDANNKAYQFQQATIVNSIIAYINYGIN